MRSHLITDRFRARRGLTLIELLVAMAISGILIAAIYRTFIGQHRTYTVQEQIVDMQQNARVAISRMMREIRMAGFGHVRDVLSRADVGYGPGVNGFTQEITPGSNPFGQTITVVGGFKQIRRGNGDPISITSAIGDQITLNYATDEFDAPDGSDVNRHRFICIGGIESNTVRSRSEKTLTLDEPLRYTHPEGTLIYKVQAITYDLGMSDGKRALRRDEHTGGHAQPVAEHIETLQFTYTLADGSESSSPADPSRIRLVKASVTARTSMQDPEFKGGAEGYRRRTVASNILVRNMGANSEGE